MFVHKYALSFILIFIIATFSVSAVSYYSGEISVENIKAHITMADSKTSNAIIYYTIKNSGYTSIQAEISFPGFPDDAEYNLSAGKGKSLRFNFQPGLTNFFVSFNQDFDSSSRLSISPGYRIDDKIPTKKVIQQQYSLDLNSNELNLISSIPEMKFISGNLYDVVLSNSYPATLRLEVVSKNVQVSATRTISGYGQIGDVVNIVTIVTNIGSASLTDLRLEDSFFAGYYEPNSDGFKSYNTQEAGESLYIYSSPIPTLSSGESYTLNYSIKVKSMGAPAFTGARILYKGNFLTSTDSNQPNIFPIQVNQQRTPVDESKAQATIIENKVPTEFESINNTSNPNEQESIFRPEEKEMFNQQVKKDNNKNLLFNIIITLFVLMIVGAGYLVWRNYKDVIMESFSDFDLSSLRFWEKNKDENK